MGYILDVGYVVPSSTDIPREVTCHIFLAESRFFSAIEVTCNEAQAARCNTYQATWSLSLCEAITSKASILIIYIQPPKSGIQPPNLRSTGVLPKGSKRHLKPAFLALGDLLVSIVSGYRAASAPSGCLRWSW
jgi:hypothetical protein